MRNVVKSCIGEPIAYCARIYEYCDECLYYVFGMQNIFKHWFGAVGSMPRTNESTIHEYYKRSPTFIVCTLKISIGNNNDDDEQTCNNIITIIRPIDRSAKTIQHGYTCLIPVKNVLRHSKSMATSLTHSSAIIFVYILRNTYRTYQFNSGRRIACFEKERKNWTVLRLKLAKNSLFSRK